MSVPADPAVAPGDLEPSAASLGFSLLGARRDDLSAILRLEAEGFEPDERWSERSWAGELLGQGRTVLIARGSQPAGVVALSTVGELADLHRVVVAPAYRRQGLGLRLVRAGLLAVRHAGARAVMLEVEWSNEAAVALYARLGFEQLHVRDDYYGPGKHALIMKLYDLEEWPDRFARAVAETTSDFAAEHVDDLDEADLVDGPGRPAVCVVGVHPDAVPEPPADREPEEAP